MKGKSYLALIFSLSALFSQPIGAQDYKTLKAQVTELEKTGDFKAAIPVAENALKQAELEYGKSNYRYAAALTKLGEIYNGAEEFGKAEKIFLEVAELDKAKFGETEMVYAESISHLALVYFYQGKYSLALPHFIQAAEIKKNKLGVGIMYANALNSVASVNLKLGKYADAEVQFTEALSYYQKEAAISEQQANAKNGLGCLYDLTGRYEDAEALLTSAVKDRKQMNGETSLIYADVLRNLAGLYKNMGRYLESEKAHEEAMVIIKNQGINTLNYSNSLYNFALLYSAIGNYRQAENMFKESLNIIKTIIGENNSSYATGLNGLANLYADIGMFTEAEVLYKKQIEIIKNDLGENHPNYATGLANLGALFYQMGRYEQAEKIYLSVLEFDRKHFGEEHIESAGTLNYMGVLYRDMMRLEKSEECFIKSLEIHKAQLSVTHPEYIKTMIGLGDTYLRAGKIKEGISLYNQSMPYFETADGKASVMYLTFINNLAVLYKATGNFKNAEKWYKEAMKLQLAQWGETSSAYVRTVANLGELYFGMNQFDKAEPLLKKVLSHYLQDIKNSFPSMSEREKSQFYKTVSFHFDLFNSFAVAKGNKNMALSGDMYNHQLVTKGMLITASLQLKSQIMKSRDAVLIDLYKSWIQKKEQIARAKKLTTAEQIKRNINIEILENESNELERTLSVKSEKFSNTASRSLHTWQQVQAKLKKDEAAIEIIRFRKYSSRLTVFTDTVFYAALVITPETKNPIIVLLENGNDLEKKYLKFHKNVIQQQRNNVNIEDKNSYQQFWQKIGEVLGNTKKVFLSVDGVYHQISLNTLINPATGKYLMDEIDIEMVTNTSDLLKTKSKNTKAKQTASLIGFPNYNMSQSERHSEIRKSGIPVEAAEDINTVNVRYIESLNTIKELPGTKVEVEGISKMLSDKKWDVKTLINNLALEESVKRQQGPTLFHIATHGFFEPDVEMEADNKNLKYENALFRSGLLLAGSAETLYKKANAMEVGKEITEDGVLTAYEAMNIDLQNTELVVLSACETGLGEVSNGEGVYGLQRAFKVAGADAIIFSLWKVDDTATQKLMNVFYQNWLTLGNKREAFNKAQRAVRDEYKLPYFWGAFVLIGD